MDEAERLCDRVAIMDHGRVIALGTPQQLIASIGGEDIVEFAVWTRPHATHSRVDAGAAHRDFWRAVAPRGRRPAPALGLASCTPLCRASLPHCRQGLHLSEFRTHSATLEDVFVRLTGRNLRDE